jgi:hypothetical protein
MIRNTSSHTRPLLAVAIMAMFGVAAAQTTGTGASGSTATTPNAGTTDMRSGTAGSSADTDSASTQFRMLDKSNRGYLQRNEVTGITGFSFDQADLNHDGRLSQDEFAQWQSSNPRAGGAMGNGSTSQSGMSGSGNTANPGAARAPGGAPGTYR